jgi:hypothetical protein
MAKLEGGLSSQGSSSRMARNFNSNTVFSDRGPINYKNSNISPTQGSTKQSGMP